MNRECDPHRDCDSDRVFPPASSAAIRRLSTAAVSCGALSLLALTPPLQVPCRDDRWGSAAE